MLNEHFLLSGLLQGRAEGLLLANGSKTEKEAKFFGKKVPAAEHLQKKEESVEPSASSASIVLLFKSDTFTKGGLEILQKVQSCTT